jgi:hypothetical protein
MQIRMSQKRAFPRETAHLRYPQVGKSSLAGLFGPLWALGEKSLIRAQIVG